MDNKLQIAFTLVELLVVIAIVGILSGLIIVGMSSSVNNARIAKAQIFSSSIRDSLLMNLVSEWKLDQVGVPGAYQTPDAWSNNTCTLYGSGGLQDRPQIQNAGCIYGSCLNFDGTDDYIDCGNPTNLNIASAITVEAWFYPKAEYTGYAAHPISKWNGGAVGANIVLYYFGQTSGSNRVFRYYADAGGSWIQISASYTASLNNWYQIVLSYNSTSGGQLYINGIATGPLVGSGDLALNSNSFVVGEGFNGLIDQVRIYNDKIPSSKIKEDYYAGINRLLAKGKLAEDQYQGMVLGI